MFKSFKIVRQLRLLRKTLEDLLSLAQEMLNLLIRIDAALTLIAQNTTGGLTKAQAEQIRDGLNVMTQKAEQIVGISPTV